MLGFTWPLSGRIIFYYPAYPVSGRIGESTIRCIRIGIQICLLAHFIYWMQLLSQGRDGLSFSSGASHISGMPSSREASDMRVTPHQHGKFHTRVGTRLRVMYIDESWLNRHVRVNVHLRRYMWSCACVCNVDGNHWVMLHINQYQYANLYHRLIRMNT